MNAMKFLGLLVVCGLIPQFCQGNDIFPFSEIHSDSLSDYNTYEFKFTYMGAQFKTVPSFVGEATDRDFDVTDFEPFERAALDYGNDEFIGDTITLSAGEFKAFVDSIGNHPEMQDTSVISEPNASLMILRDFGQDTKCWEHLASRDETQTLFLMLYESINPTRIDVRTTVTRFRLQMAGVKR